MLPASLQNEVLKKTPTLNRHFVQILVPEVQKWKTNWITFGPVFAPTVTLVQERAPRGPQCHLRAQKGAQMEPKDAKMEPSGLPD